MNLNALLPDYIGSLGLYQDSDGQYKLNASSADLCNYLNIEYHANLVFSGNDGSGAALAVNGGTVISTDTCGTGQYETLLTLYGTQASLEEMLLNHQLVV
ncbi:hypothetical protein [Stenoxybacter acetivorans]|uniref:hypothetical protein n=1 Tax=Stenoxybacter acetivorans TaxID=422441 RepID=UPI00055FD0C0|nr:hypothetical protein [Stenoxybacter acetivorans]